jgi:hypothetical protein
MKPKSTLSLLTHPGRCLRMGKVVRMIEQSGFDPNRKRPFPWVWWLLTFPRKSGHGLRGFCLCLLWGDVADGGVDPRTIVAPIPRMKPRF